MPSQSLTLTAMSVSDAEIICSWVYEPPYDCYNWPSWKAMCEQEIEFADDAIRRKQYCSLVLAQKLVGYIQLFPLASTMRLAIFLAPEHCGRGLGRHATALAIAEAGKRMPGAEIDLEVECWNQRAINSYAKSGFTITDQYSYSYKGVMREVFCMVYKPEWALA